MAQFKLIHKGLKLLPVDFKRQVIPGSFEYALCHLVDHELDLSAFHIRYKNEIDGASAFGPVVLIKIILLAYSIRLSNLTDNESAKMATGKGVIQGYSGIATVDEKTQIIIGFFYSVVRIRKILRLLLLILCIFCPLTACACPSEVHMSVADEISIARWVVTGTVLQEQYSAEGPGHDWADGTFYTIRVAKTIFGEHHRTVRVFSENSSGRFPMNKDVTYLLFVSLCDGQLYIDARGNSGPLREKIKEQREVQTIIGGRHTVDKKYLLIHP